MTTPVGARRSARSRRLAVVVAVTLSATVLTAASSPARWDPRIEPIANAVARIRGLEWKRPVSVRFLSDAAFRRVVTAGNEHEAASQAKALEDIEAQLRALGLASGGVDLADALRAYASDNVLAFYEPRTKRVTVRGTRLTPMLRVTIAHELTHALDDQHFDLERLDDRAKTSGQVNAVEAVVEGNASRIESGFLSDMSEADRAAVARTQASWRAQAPATETESAAPLPEVLGALYDAPYVLGPHLVKALLDEGGDAALARALRRAPASDEAVFDPLLVAASHPRIDVPTPRLTNGERRIGAPDDFGPLTLYLLLASRLDPVTAMDATGAWAGDAAVVYRSSGRACLRVRFVAHDAAGVAKLDRALGSVAAQLPGNTATILAGAEGTNTLTLTACDPGDVAEAPPPYAEQALALLDLRNWSATEALAAGLPPAASRCVSDTVVRDPAWQALAAPDADPTPEQVDDAFARYRTFVIGCGGTT